MRNQHFSRRNFLKIGAISSVAIAGTSVLASCETKVAKEKLELFPLFKGENYSAEDGVAGLLFSQVGYSAK